MLRRATSYGQDAAWHNRPDRHDAAMPHVGRNRHTRNNRESLADRAAFALRQSMPTIAEKDGTRAATAAVAAARAEPTGGEELR